MSKLSKMPEGNDVTNNVPGVGTLNKRDCHFTANFMWSVTY